MSSVDVIHPGAASASDRDEACWKNTPVPPAPPEREKQMTEKPSYEPLRVLIRLAVVHKRECGAFLRRSIVKVE